VANTATTHHDEPKKVEAASCKTRATPETLNRVGYSGCGHKEAMFESILTLHWKSETGVKQHMRAD